jgi:hypothetical protein
VIIPVGEIVLFTSGEYSDYGLIGLFRVIKELDEDKLPKDNKRDWRRNYRVVGQLVREGFIEEINFKEFWISDYGDGYTQVKDIKAKYE